jgi:hypothetical protein
MHHFDAFTKLTLWQDLFETARHLDQMEAEMAAMVVLSHGSRLGRPTLEGLAIDIMGDLDWLTDRIDQLSVRTLYEVECLMPEV